MRHILILLIALCFSPILSAQSSSKVEKRGITKRSITEISYENGANEEIIEEEKWFDEEGNVIELKERDNKGKLKNWVKYTYTKKNDVETELYLNANGKLLEKIEYRYEDGLRTEKLYYDGKERLVKKKVYAYEYKERD